MGTQPTPHPTAPDRDIVLSDKEVIRWYECERKRAYTDLLRAEHVADRTMAHSPTNQRGIATVLQAYVCEHCQRYHVGHMRTAGNNLSYPDRLRRAISAYRRTQ